MKWFIYNYKVICTTGYWYGKGISEYSKFSDAMKNYCMLLVRKKIA
ncbi:hypothetical protein [Clostridium beijerinckii]|nr:hypothetical protein [Clostridium beijerinckii]NYC53016.1 hypothetical protein [Clostridium beijerinckii]QUF72001.1 hypothetical protein KDJ94_14850 [Clostridium beijerinckii]